MILDITRWRSLTDAQGKRSSLSWEALTEALMSPLPRPVDAEEVDLPGWSPAVFVGDRRAKGRVRTITALGVDLDKGAITRDRLHHVFNGTQTFVHNTRRSTPAAPRWRVVRAVSRPVLPAEYAAVWTAERDRLSELSVVLDEQTKDASRFWFVPCVPLEGDFVGEPFDGEVLNVDAAVEMHRLREEARRRAMVAARKEDRRVVVGGAHRYAMGALARATAAVERAPKGERNATLNREAWSVGRFVVAGQLDEGLVRRAFADAGYVAGLRRGEVDATIDSALSGARRRSA